MRLPLGLLCIALAASATSAAAQTWTPEQQVLWKLEEQQWKMSAAKDLSWIPTMVHPNMSAWDNEFPAPQSIASLTRWSKISASEGTTLEQEIFPIAATITGSVAVVQYRYRQISENSKKEHKTNNGRWTDVFVKDGGRWQFITWAGGPDAEPK